MSEGGAALIAFQGVRKAFGEKRVFDGLDLQVRRGEVLSIVGGSGTGKSVLLKLLIGLLPADAGAIRFDGQEVTAMGEEQLFGVRRRIAMLFQGGALFDSLSVGENVAYPLRTQLTLPEDEVRARVAEKLALVGLPGVESLMPAALSGGMRKRVALARAMVTDPEVILFDEPTAGLDPPNTRRIDDLIRDVQARLSLTAIVVTHDLPSAYMVSDRIAMLEDRRILAVLPTDEFRRAPLPGIRAFVNAMEPGGGR